MEAPRYAVTNPPYPPPAVQSLHSPPQPIRRRTLDINTYVIRQVEGVRSLLGGVLDGVTTDEWLSSPSPGTNPIGFTAWHIPSIQDWAIHTWMQGVPTIRSRPEWVAKGMSTSFIPIGMGLESAHEIAKRTTPANVLEYADAVLETARDFVRNLPPQRFDEVPPNKLHLSDPRYESPGYHADVDDMFDYPRWRLLAGACSGHCRGHLAELDLGLSIIRSR